ncbi:MAG TPA: hypothetical protein VFR08_12015 [Candidatus Angelobacter sp.]|nr:hypothetical protein [Candidatus Angelobacter sp.]
MKHLSEEQIVLHYYGDAEDTAGVAQHLGECAACRAEFERVQSLLQHIEPIQIPEPSAAFEEKTWLNIRDRLPEKRGWTAWLQSPKEWALAGSMVALLVAAFVAGRFWPHAGTVTPAPPVIANSNPQQVVLVAVGNHLERSEMLLVEIMNSDGKAPLDFSNEQERARDLLDANHLYRVSAQQSGDPKIAHLLDQLGRVLAEVANGPEKMSPEDLKEIRGRIESEGLLFKVRVVGSDVNSRVRRREQSTPANATQRL